MARVTIEDCLVTVNNHFALVMVAVGRARQLANGAVPLVACDNRVAVTSLREIASGKVTALESVDTVLRAHAIARYEMERDRKGGARAIHRRSERPANG
jgi:DNA-directed RNA polymerase omega subunit